MATDRALTTWHILHKFFVAQSPCGDSWIGWPLAPGPVSLSDLKPIQRGSIYGEVWEIFEGPRMEWNGEMWCSGWWKQSGFEALLTKKCLRCRLQARSGDRSKRCFCSVLDPFALLKFDSNWFIHDKFACLLLSLSARLWPRTHQWFADLCFQMDYLCDGKHTHTYTKTTLYILYVYKTR